MADEAKTPNYVNECPECGGDLEVSVVIELNEVGLLDGVIHDYVVNCGASHESDRNGVCIDMNSPGVYCACRECGHKVVDADLTPLLGQWIWMPEYLRRDIAERLRIES